MGNQARNAFLGLNYQSWAALSVFLQHLRYNDLSEMHLEASKMQDFDLYFKDGRKIICEAKARKAAFSESALKGLFNDLKKKKVVLLTNDEFLVITTKASDDLRRMLKRVRDYPVSYAKHAVENTSFCEEEVELLQKVRIYEIGQEDSAKIAFALASELIGSWLDSSVLQQVVKSILVDKVFHGSAKGAVFKASELKELLRQESERIRANVGANTQPPIDRLTAIKQAVKDPKDGLWAPANLSAISAHWGEVALASDLLKDETSLTLSDWARVINALVTLRLSHRAFEIIKNNLHSADNVQFALDFLVKHSSKLRASYFLDFLETELMELGRDIFRCDRSTGLTILKALDSLMGHIGNSKLLVKTNDREKYFRQQVGKLANIIYEEGDEELRQGVVKFIARSFCLVEDEGEFWHKASPEIYEIIHKYLCFSVKTFVLRFEELVSLFASQYSEIYKRKFKLPFRGYELIGGVSSWWGNAYQVHDRHFVSQTLAPALTWFLSSAPTKALTFLASRCVFEDKKVGKDSPDFLRRAAIPVLMKVFRENISNKRKKARFLLSVLLRSRKGIPSKHELIYQVATHIPDESLVWELLKDALQASDKPINPFVEKTACSLASKGHSESIKVVRSWLSSEERWSDSIFGGGPLELLKSVSKYDVEGTFKTLEELTLGKYFNRERREIDIYDWCDFLVTFVKSHPAKVTKLLKRLHGQEHLSESQQVLVMGSIAKVGKDENFSESEKLSFYTDVVDCVVHDNHLLTKFPVPHIREQLTEFVEGLVKKDPSPAAVECALSIIEILVNDPSPDVEKDTRLTNDSEVFAIESVRGKTALALQHFFAPLARPYLDRSRAILEKLLADESTYIRGMACYPFSILLANRFTFTSEDLQTPLLGDSLEGAYEKAKALEKRATLFVGENVNVSKNLTKNIPKVFDQLRFVDGQTAKKLWQLAESAGVDLMKEVLPILIFNSHFRDRFFDRSHGNENPFASLIGKEKFDSSYFREKLAAITLHENDSLRAALSRHIMNLSNVEEEDRAEENVPISLEYFKLLSRRYDQDVFLWMYTFIDKHLSEHFDDCIQLWFTLIEVEEKAIKKAIADGASLHDVLWWPYCFNGKLLSYAASKNIDLFLRGVEVLLEYPTDVRVDLDDDIAAALLNLSAPRDRILSIYKLWIERDPIRINDMGRWLNSH